MNSFGLKFYMVRIHSQKFSNCSLFEPSSCPQLLIGTDVAILGLHSCWLGIRFDTLPGELEVFYEEVVAWAIRMMVF
jgi:hypothetical protein